ncbi:MAG: hemolysin family protein [Ancalomicrobiaceae bacterium]|nr:hemolysin family protein [Ancalomicrobiaceae bacterium]
MIGLELVVFVALTLLNAFFVMSEMALVSARKSRLAPLADEGNERARLAMELGEEPPRFLSAVQIGITVTSLLVGAVSGATFSSYLANWLKDVFPTTRVFADETAFAVVIVVMTFVTLVFAELVPKRIAIARPEPIAMEVAGIIVIISRICAPFVALLAVTSDAVLRLIGVDDDNSDDVTEQEVKHILTEGVESGVLEPEEREMLEGVMRVADRPVRAIMTPRPDLYWIDLQDAPERLAQEIVECPYSLVVAADGSIDEPAGIIYKKDLLGAALAGETLDLAQHLRQPIVVPENAPVLKLLELLRGMPVHCAFVVDEYGSLQGLITLTDIMEGITGDFVDVDAPHGGPVERDDGSWLIDGDTSIDDLNRMFDLPELDHGGYHTLGGLILAALNRIPTEGDKTEIGEFTFEVVDMDARRIDKVLVSPKAKPLAAQSKAAD